MEEKETRKIKHDLSEAESELYVRTKSGNIIMYLIIAASIIVYVTTGRGGVAVELGMGTLILGLLQYLWQGFALELFVRDLERNNQDGFDRYPDHISKGAWVIYVLKMIVAILAAVELILSISC